MFRLLARCLIRGMVRFGPQLRRGWPAFCRCRIMSRRWGRRWRALTMTGKAGSSALRLLDDYHGGGVDSFAITARLWRFGSEGVEYLSEGLSVRTDSSLLGTGDAASVTVLYSASASEGAVVRVALGQRSANTQWLISVYALRADLTLGYFSLTAWRPESILVAEPCCRRGGGDDAAAG